MRVERVDYTNPQQAAELVALLNAYAQEPLGGGTALSAEVRSNLPTAMAKVPGAYSFIVRDAGVAVALLNAFTGFSTFNARPLINIHDVYVAPAARGQGAVELLFGAIEEQARRLHCCKITLEVLEENLRAQGAYKRLGFKGYDLGEKGGEALFWQKKLG